MPASSTNGQRVATLVAHDERIAGFGHIAVALASARLRGDDARARPRAWRRAWRMFAGYSALAMLPDADVLPAQLLALKGPLSDHRGLTHTPLFALAVGLLVALVAYLARRSARARAVRLGLLATLLVGSHGLLDGLTQGGRGILFLWPLSGARFHCLWRPFPDIPAGLALLTRNGLHQLGLEIVIFLPLALYALAWRSLWRAAPRTSRPAAGGSMVEVTARAA